MVVNGWKLYAYPLFDEQLKTIEERIKTAKRTGTIGDKKHPAEKLLARTLRYTQDLIPADPGAPQFRQGNTRGKENRQWFRAKFHERYRLFFRFSTQERAIVYVWMNNEDTLRKRDSKTDAYAVFESMLESGDPPKSFDDLLARARAL